MNKKKLSNNKLPTKEIFGEMDTGRSDCGPSSRRHLHQESRDSKDFFFSVGNNTPKSGTWMKHRESVDDENLTSEGTCAIPTDGPMVKSKFNNKVHPGKKESSDLDASLEKKKTADDKKIDDMDFWAK